MGSDLLRFILFVLAAHIFLFQRDLGLPQHGGDGLLLGRALLRLQQREYHGARRGCRGLQTSDAARVM